MTTANLTTTANPENVNLEDLREINLSDEEWDEPQQQVLPNFKIPSTVNQHRKLRQSLQRLVEESSFGCVLDELRQLAEDKSEWYCLCGNPGQEVPASTQAELLDLLSMSVGRASERARRWSL